MPSGFRAVADSKKLLDVLCRQVVFARDHYACVKCGRGQGLSWCHVKSRRYLSTRWRLENSLSLCQGDHLWAHHNPLEFAEWFNNRWPDRARMLRFRPARGNKVDMGMTRIYLEQELAKYEIGGRT